MLGTGSAHARAPSMSLYLTGECGRCQQEHGQEHSIALKQTATLVVAAAAAAAAPWPLGTLSDTGVHQTLSMCQEQLAAMLRSPRVAAALLLALALARGTGERAAQHHTAAGKGEGHQGSFPVPSTGAGAATAALAQAKAFILYSTPTALVPSCTCMRSPQLAPKCSSSPLTTQLTTMQPPAAALSLEQTRI